MAYDPSSLSIVAYTYANRFTLWHYKTADQLLTISTDGYFNGAADMMRVGDMILMNAGDGSAIVTVTENNKDHVRGVYMPIHFEMAP